MATALLKMKATKYSCYNCKGRLSAEYDEIDELNNYRCEGCAAAYLPYQVELDKLPATMEKLRELDKENDIDIRQENIKYMCGDRWRLRIWTREYEGLKLKPHSYHEKIETAIMEAYRYLAKTGKLSA